MVNFTIYLCGGFRKLPRLQCWLPRASWSLQVCLNGSWEVFDAAYVVLLGWRPWLLSWRPLLLGWVQIASRLIPANHMYGQKSPKLWLVQNENLSLSEQPSSSAFGNESLDPMIATLKSSFGKVSK